MTDDYLTNGKALHSACELPEQRSPRGKHHVGRHGKDAFEPAAVRPESFGSVGARLQRTADHDLP